MILSFSPFFFGFRKFRVKMLDIFGKSGSPLLWVTRCGEGGEPIFPQPPRGENLFVGRRWELGAENLRLSC